jgi:N-acetyl-beta-hexosaminidase
MSWVKLNHFHWHVVDSQSFALVVPGFEELAQKGAYSPTQVYTPDDVKDIVAYAASVGAMFYWGSHSTYAVAFPHIARYRHLGRN